MDDLLILDMEKVPGIRCRDLRNGRLRTGKKNGTAAFARHLEVGWVPPTNVGEAMIFQFDPADTFRYHETVFVGVPGVRWGIRESSVKF